MQWTLAQSWMWPLLAQVAVDAPEQKEARRIISPFTEFILEPIQRYPMVGLLIMLIGIDIATGLISAFITKKLSSNTSFTGMGRKVLMTLMTGFGAVIEPYAQGIPVAKLIASYYCLTESLSIIENVGKAGVPIPSWLKLRLEKSRQELDGEKSTTMNVQHVDKIIMQRPPSAVGSPADSQVMRIVNPDGTPISSGESKGEPQS